MDLLDRHMHTLLHVILKHSIIQMYTFRVSHTIISWTVDTGFKEMQRVGSLSPTPMKFRTYMTKKYLSTKHAHSGSVALTFAC